MITLPLHLDLPRKRTKDKRIALNLNTYRNLHHQTLNQCKKQFHEEVRGQLKELPFYDKIQIDYLVFLGRSIGDLDNVGAVIAKYFQDSLVLAGKIADDNYKHITGYTVRFGGIDRASPRCQVTIKEVV